MPLFSCSIDNLIRENMDVCDEAYSNIRVKEVAAVSQEQINIFHMHGYTAAWIIPAGLTLCVKETEILRQEKQKYAVIMIKKPKEAPFYLIPNAYKTLPAYMKVNRLEEKSGKAIIIVLPLFLQKEYLMVDDRN